MRDKSLGIFLAVLFGISGTAVLVLGWLWPMLAPERITASLVGSAGLLIALIQLLALKRLPVRTNDEKFPVQAEAENKS